MEACNDTEKDFSNGFLGGIRKIFQNSFGK